MPPKLRNNKYKQFNFGIIFKLIFFAFYNYRKFFIFFTKNLIIIWKIIGDKCKARVDGQNPIETKRRFCLDNELPLPSNLDGLIEHVAMAINISIFFKKKFLPSKMGSSILEKGVAFTNF